MNGFTHADVVVIGLGAMGSAACYQLARRGVRAMGFDQYGVPHTMGSSHGDSRITRLCYYEHPDYVPLLKRAHALWRDLQTRGGATLFHQVGGIFIGPPNSEFIAGTLKAARDQQLAHDVLDRAQLAARFPQFRVPDDHIGVFEPTAGFLLPERIIATHIELALKHGAAIHTYEPLLRWEDRASHIAVHTSRGTYTADRIIFCGGAWSEKLLGDIGVTLQVTRQALGWVWPNKPERFALGTIPVWAISNPDGSLHYGFPMLPGGAFGRAGFKIGHHFHGEPTTANAINRMPQPEDELDFRHVLRRFIPDADGPLLSMAICMYTNTTDSHFIIDRHPKHERAFIACGFSGHGFKFASVVGEIMADLAMHGRTEHPIGFLGLKRFGRAD